MSTSNDEQVEHKSIEHEHASRANIDIKEDVIFHTLIVCYKYKQLFSIQNVINYFYHT